MTKTITTQYSEDGSNIINNNSDANYFDKNRQPMDWGK